MDQWAGRVRSRYVRGFESRDAWDRMAVNTPLAYEVALLGYDRAIRHRKSCVRGLQGLQIVRGEIFLPSEIVGS